MLFNFLYAMQEMLALAEAGRLENTREFLVEHPEDTRRQKDYKEKLFALSKHTGFTGIVAKAVQTIVQKDKVNLTRDERIHLLHQVCCNVSAAAGSKAIPQVVRAYLEGKGIIIDGEEFLAAGSISDIVKGHYQRSSVVVKVVKDSSIIVGRFVAAANAPAQMRSGVCSEGIADFMVKTQMEEQNLLREAGCMALCRNILRDIPVIHIPTVYPDASNEKHLVMDFAEGVPLEAVCLRYTPEMRKAITTQILFSVFYLIKRGVWLTDLNIGSAKVIAEGDQLQRLSLLDFGSFEMVDINGKGDALINFIMTQDRATFTEFLSAFGYREEPSDALMELYVDLIKPFGTNAEFSFAYNAAEAGRYEEKVARSVKARTKGPGRCLVDLKFLGQLGETLELLLGDVPLNVHAIVREATQGE